MKPLWYFVGAIMTEIQSPKAFVDAAVYIVIRLLSGSVVEFVHSLFEYSSFVRGIAILLYVFLISTHYFTVSTCLGTCVTIGCLAGWLERCCSYKISLYVHNPTVLCYIKKCFFPLRTILRFCGTKRSAGSTSSLFVHFRVKS
jgi:hypothetical protein